VPSVRALLLVLLVGWIAGTPGLGIDTRSGGSIAIGVVYGVAFLLGVVALVLTWRSRRWASTLAIVLGIAAIVLAVADLAGLTDTERPPTLMAAVDVAIVLVGAALAWSAWRDRAALRVGA
jgi:hypothetical protein